MDFVIGEGRKFSICHLKIRTYSLYLISHTICNALRPLQLWSAEHTLPPPFSEFLGRKPLSLLETPGGLPVPGPHLFTAARGTHALRWASGMTHHTRGQGGLIRFFSKAGSKVFSPTSSLSVGTAQLGR